jgi:hypothetical protein
LIVARTDDEVDAQLNLAMESANSGRSRWPGMSYEQGVDAAIRWLIGDVEDPPMEDE